MHSEKRETNLRKLLENNIALYTGNSSSMEFQLGVK